MSNENRRLIDVVIPFMLGLFVFLVVLGAIATACHASDLHIDSAGMTFSIMLAAALGIGTVSLAR